jgi:hypothetical protein
LLAIITARARVCVSVWFRFMGCSWEEKKTADER